MPIVNLTDAFIRKCQCAQGKKVDEFRDRDVRGLELRVSANGTKSWRLHYTRRSDGKRRVVGLGRYPALSLKDARAKAKGIQSRIECPIQRADPAEDSQQLRRAETFAELTAEWCDRHGVPNKSPRALRDDKSMLARHILPYIGKMKAAEIRKSDIVRVFDAVANKSDARVGMEGKSRCLTHRPNRVFELVRAIFRWGLSRDLVKNDPTAGLSRPIKNEAQRERFLSDEEIVVFWRALNDVPNQRRITTGLPRGERALSSRDVSMTKATALALKLALVTGQRISEIVGIERGELMMDGLTPTWTVPAARTKNKKTNRVPLSALAVSVIEEAKQLSPNSRWLFPNQAGARPIRADAATKALARSSEALGLDNFRVHDLRRTAASHMAMLEVSPHTISLILNHATARKGNVTSAVYIQYSYDKEKREALEKWGKKMELLLSSRVKANGAAETG